MMSDQTKGPVLPGAINTNSITIKQGPDLEVRKATIAKDGRIPLHNHPFGQSHVVVQGKGFYLSDDGKTPVEAGFTNYSSPGEVHGWENAGPSDLVFVSSSASSEGVYQEDNDKWNIHYVK